MPRGIPKSKNPQAYSNPTVDLAKRARELAEKDGFLREWEAGLDRKQAAMDDTTAVSVELKVIQAKVDAKKEELETLQRKIEQLTTGNTEQIKALDKKTEQAKERKEAADGAFDAAVAAAEGVESVIKTAKVKLKDIETEIKVRQQYREDQERLIDDSINEGNQTLAGIHREVKSAEHEREDLLAKIHLDKMTIAAATITTDKLKEDTARLGQRYEEAAASYRQELVDLKRSIEEKRIERDRIVAETDQKLLEIRSERAELEVTREVTQKQKEDVFAEKRRLDSMKATYGL